MLSTGDGQGQQSVSTGSLHMQVHPGVASTSLSVLLYTRLGLRAEQNWPCTAAAQCWSLSLSAELRKQGISDRFRFSKSLHLSQLTRTSTEDESQSRRIGGVLLFSWWRQSSAEYLQRDVGKKKCPADVFKWKKTLNHNCFTKIIYK